MRRLLAAFCAFLIPCVAFAQLFFPLPPIPSTCGTTWSSTDKDPAVSLSNSNQTAAKNSANGFWRSVRGTTSHTVGQYYFEITTDPAAGTGSFWMGGVADASASLANFIGNDTHGYSCQSSGALWYNGTNPGNCGIDSSNSACTYLQVAIDLTNNLGWWKANCASLWNATSGASPGGTGGLSLHIAGGSTAIFSAWSGFDSGTDSGTLRTGCPVLLGTAAPSGFLAWN